MSKSCRTVFLTLIGLAFCAVSIVSASEVPLTLVYSVNVRGNATPCQH